MNQGSNLLRVALLAAMALLFLLVPTSESVHLYRSEDAGCSAAAGELSDDPAVGGHGPIAAEVLLLHNTFQDAANGTAVTRVRVGEAVRWLWASSHCHSVDGRGNASMASRGDSSILLAGLATTSAVGVNPHAAGLALLCLGASLASAGIRGKGLWLFAALCIFSVMQSSCGDDDGGPSSSASGTQAGSLVFYSGFHFPETPPDSPQGIPGLFEYPALDPEPSLTYVHTFDTPGTFPYTCEHHGAIGMAGVVIVEE